MLGGCFSAFFQDNIYFGISCFPVNIFLGMICLGFFSYFPFGVQGQGIGSDCIISWFLLIFYIV